MIRPILISSICLSVFALGPSAFGGDKPEDLQGQADGLRNLLEVAGRKGLVQLSGSDIESEDASAEPEAEEAIADTVPIADCMALAPLFDGGQDGFATGMFTELTQDWPETTDLARSLATLVDPSYRGESLAIDLRRAGDCGPSFLPWQALANPAETLDAQTEAELTQALSDMDPALKRLIGVQIAIRAGMAGNLRLTRRIADSLTDEGLHNQPHHDRDLEHVLLDALLKMQRDPVGARARLSWIAERDGPEQFYAIDLLRALDASPEARSELTRLSDSPDEEQRQSAHTRLIATAIEDSDIELVAEMVTTTDLLNDDVESLARLTARLEQAIAADDPLRAIQALDVIERLEAKGVEFGPALLSRAASRLASLSETPTQKTSNDFASALPVRAVPDALSGPELDTYLGDLSGDITAFQEVLSHG